MIRVFQPTDKIYTSNGDKILKPSKARVICKDNGDFYLNINCPIEYSAYIVPNNIIVAPTPQGEQAFRISEVSKNKHKVEAKALHVFFDSQNYVIPDKYATSITAGQALAYLNANTDATSPFTTASNITSINNYRCVRKSLYEAIMDVKARWGGHLLRDNWNITLNSSIGQDKGLVIAYRKNLQDLKATYNFDNVVTKLLPVGKDGILLPELYVYSSTQYDIPFTKVVTFSQDDIKEEDYTDEEGVIDTEAYQAALIADLRQQATQYVEANNLPTVNYTLKAQPSKIANIGDIIEVKDQRIGIDVTTEVIAYEYDAIMEKYVSLEFGNFGRNLSNLLTNIDANTKSTVDKAVSDVSSETDRIYKLLQSENIVCRGYDLLALDRLPPEDAVNVLKISQLGISQSSAGVAGTYSPVYNMATKELTASSINLGGDDLAELIDSKTEYVAGSTETLTNYYAVGKILPGASSLVFTIVLPKKLNSAPTISSLTLEVTGTSGSTATYTVTGSGWTISKAISSSGSLTLTCTSSNGLTFSANEIIIISATGALSFS